MEGVVNEGVVNPAFWRGKRVVLTGHTGFKGSWLALWLQNMGAELTGLALPPDTTPALFELANVTQFAQFTQGMTSVFGDIRDAAIVEQTLQAANPEILLHLAAQPLVSEGYRDPVGTYATNVMGTINVLQAARHCPALKAIVVVTTDKCYANPAAERVPANGFRESDHLGGSDPYSNSKACTELVASAWRDSFLRERGIALATARAGNVIGGGDWATHRLVPDILAAFANGQAAQLRNPNAIRPWQHVLDPLAGYLQLAQALCQHGEAVAQGWNFAPRVEDAVPGGELASRMARIWQQQTGKTATWQSVSADFPKEAAVLRLDASKARQQLGWQPHWTLDQALEKTIDWHGAWLNGADMAQVCLQQITEHAKNSSHD